MSTRSQAVGVWALVACLVAVMWVTRAHATSTASPFDGLPPRPTTYADGQHAFIMTQPERIGVPVGWDPCRTIPVRLNPDHATPGAEQQVRTAIAVVDQVSGLQLAYAGATTTTRTNEPWDSGEIVVSFTTNALDSSLDGAVANSQSQPDGAQAPDLEYYVSGRVTVNWPVFEQLPAWNQEAVLLHEFGHAVGLAHVVDDRQIMSAYGVGTATYQHGDLTGLAILGRLPCQ